MPEISVRNKISSIARIVISLRQSNMVGAKAVKAVKILCFLCVKPKCRSWILVFSRKERKDRKAYRDGGLLLDFQAHPLF